MPGLIPEIQVRQVRESEYGEVYRQWRQERADKFEQWEPEKIDWRPDPGYETRFLTIRAAREWYNPLKQPVWFIVGALMFGSWAFWDLMLLLRLR